MNVELTPTGRVILGMIGLGRRTGYDIKRLVDDSTRFFWAASYGQIYPELKRLERAGLIEGRAEPAGGRPRRVYELTPAGEQALREWLTSPGELTWELRCEGFLRLFFGDALEPDEAIEHVRRMRARHEATLAELRALEPATREERDELGHVFPYLTLQGGIALHEYAVELCRRMEEQLAAVEA
jgi:DNA-binding PadR family transcriptional regulator